MLLVLTVLSIAGYSLYHHGEKAGEVAVHRIALRDSVTHQVAVVDTATARSDRVVAVARTAVRASNRGRAQLESVLTDTTSHVPPAVVAQVTAQLERDSTTITVQGAAIDTLLAERAVRVEMDTLLVHEATFKPPGDGV